MKPNKKEIDISIPHAQPGEVIDVSPLGDSLGRSPTTTLIKTASLEVLRLVLPKGKEIAPHAVTGEVIVQCLEGHVVFRTHGTDCDLTAGKLVCLAGSDEHALRAVDDSSLLVTIQLQR